MKFRIKQSPSTQPRLPPIQISIDATRNDLFHVPYDVSMYQGAVVHEQRETKDAECQTWAPLPANGWLHKGVQASPATRDAHSQMWEMYTDRLEFDGLEHEDDLDPVHDSRPVTAGDPLQYLMRGE